jgi:hypothetical protein
VKSVEEGRATRRGWTNLNLLSDTRTGFEERDKCPYITRLKFESFCQCTKEGRCRDLVRILGNRILPLLGKHCVSDLILFEEGCNHRKQPFIERSKTRQVQSFILDHPCRVRKHRTTRGRRAGGRAYCVSFFFVGHHGERIIIGVVIFVIR